MSLVLLVNPPNTNQVRDDVSCTLTRPEDLTDWANLPSLGVLTLASALVPVPGVTPVYLDGTVVPWPQILAFVEDHADELLAVCVSMLTASYEAGLELLRHVKAVRPAVRTVVGNDHVTALARQCLGRRRDCIDYAFAGNEVVGPFRDLIADLHLDRVRSPDHYPGLVTWTDDGLVATPQRPEPVFTDHDYRLVDAHFPHSPHYRANFAARVAPRLRELLGVELRDAVPMELARGCIKFSRDDACTFCSIQYGGMWRNSVPDAERGWRVVEHAVHRGYDFLSLTADELPLTFGSLLRQMVDSAPAWWRATPEQQRPVFAGYARADGLSSPRHAATLRALGVRYLMVGLDAGSPLSLSALNKPLAPARGGDPRYRAERMFQHNLDAMDRARDEGIFLKTGFVVGHIGMTRRLLEENIDSICALVDGGKGAIASSDIEVLSPEPGSLDHRFLTDPALAAATARRLGLEIGDADVREEIAEHHAGLDIVDREEAMADYVRALMPELTLDDLARARERLREHCRNAGVYVGE